jgi:hypothetical protein
MPDAHNLCGRPFQLSKRVPITERAGVLEHRPTGDRIGSSLGRAPFGAATEVFVLT